MDNLFYKIEEEVFFREDIIYDEEKIKEFIIDYIKKKLNEKIDKEKPFYFEEIVYDFFDYINIGLLKSKKTRDFGIDGIIKLNLQLIGEVNLGVQIKYKLIDSTDIDSFLSSLRNAELQ